MPTTFRVSTTTRRAHPTILAALLAINDVPGAAIVYIDPGEYDESFVIGSEVELRPTDGPGTVTISASDGVTVESNGRLVLSDLKIVNRGQAAVKVNAGQTIIQNCDIWGYGKASIQALSGSTLKMTECVTHNGRVSLTAAKGTLVRSEFRDAADNAIAVVDGSEAHVRDCVIANTGLLGVRVHSSTAKISKCEFTGTGSAAISIDTHSSATIADCRIHEVHSYGIQFNQANGILEDTVVVDAETGIWATNGARPTVRRCKIEDARDAGVFVDDRAGGEFTDLEVLKAGNAGFAVGKMGTPEVYGLQVDQTVTGVLIAESKGKFSAVTVENSDVGIKVRERGTGEFTDTRLSHCEYGLEVHGYSSTASMAESRIEDIKSAGVYVGDDGRATLSDCVIERALGGGMNVSGGRITAKDTQVIEAGIGGVYVREKGSLVAERLSVTKSHGYGLWAKNEAWLDVSSSVFTDNEGDGVLATDQSTGQLISSVVTGNSRDVVVTSTVRVETETTKPAIVTDTAALAELEELIGLAAVKKQVRTQVNLIRVGQQRTKAGLPAPETSRHLIFSGPPGTGKTTVARLYGRILAGLGVLEKGQVIEVSRGDLVGQYLGSTADKTRTTFERAVGGVLFIDEAFALSRVFGANSDFGQEAIDELVKLMEDRRSEVVVIAAGYTDEMKSFLDMNPGLKSRFSRVIEFPPYNAEELTWIFEHLAGKNHYEVHKDVRGLVQGMFARQDGHGNARDARNLLEAMMERHAERLADIPDPTRDELLWLLPSDFPDDADHS
ncbi:right-handed parallel beta-helix repeat-containing protein [Actinocrispum sp. NPDC049592]|uniref:right-handed parallel beta-helix repeat-containing protein n=1 Tax=Actinocrispum sp. NPDC049592 TaxID=3154835 RepID=UPI003440C8A3